MTMTQTQSGTYVTPPMTVDQALDLAHTRLKAGLIEEAQEICRQVQGTAGAVFVLGA